MNDENDVMQREDAKGTERLDAVLLAGKNVAEILKGDLLSTIAKQVIVPYSFNKLHKVAMPEAWLAGIDRIEEG